MVVIRKIVVQKIKTRTCDEPIEYAMIYEDDGHIDCIAGITCRCGNGCNHTDRLPEENQEFKNKEELFEFMEN